jgi:hypothetical protein
MEDDVEGVVVLDEVWEVSEDWLDWRLKGVVLEKRFE